MVFSAPSGCYYGLLNVLDPSVSYDSNGKIVSVLRLPNCGSETQDTQRDPNDDQHVQDDDDVRAAEEPMVKESDVERAMENAEEPVLEEPAAESAIEDKSRSPETVHVEDKKPLDTDNSSAQGFFTVPSVGHAVMEEAPSVRSRTPIKVETVDSECPSELEQKPQDAPVSSPALFQENLGVSSMGAFSSGASVARSTVSAPPRVQTARFTPRLEPEADLLPPIQEVPIPMFVTNASNKSVPEQQLEPEQELLEPTVKPKTETEIQDVPQSIALVADYTEATPLFKTILRKNWKAVLYFLRTGSFSFSPLLGSVDMAGVELQVQTWVSKKDSYGTEMWRQLPLHAAICYGAPAKVIEKLVDAYPGALESPDSHGNLPLHLAFIFDADDSVAASLMKAFPGSLHILNAEGLQPIQCSNEICSQTFQSKAELFGALSDYTRAVAESDPERLEEQLQDVHRQLKAVNDTLFSTAPPRKVEAIKEYLAESNTSRANSTAMVSYGPSAFLAEIATGICPMSSGYNTQEDALPTGAVVAKRAKSNAISPSTQESIRGRETPVVDNSESHSPVVPVDSAIAVIASGSALVVPVMPEKAVAPDAPQHKACRVMEFDPKSRTWREV